MEAEWVGVVGIIVKFYAKGYVLIAMYYLSRIVCPLYDIPVGVEDIPAVMLTSYEQACCTSHKAVDDYMAVLTAGLVVVLTA